SMALHGRTDSWSICDLNDLQALWRSVAANGSVFNSFVNRWSGVQISHPAPTNQRVTVVSAIDLSRNRGTAGGTRVSSSDKVAANKTYSPRFLLSMTPTVVQQYGAIDHDEPTPVRVHGCGRAACPRSKSSRGDLRSPYQGRARHRPLGWA